MPISLTTKTQPTFKKLGVIRKGVTVMSKGKNPKPRPKEVDYFVMDFYPEEAEARREFYSKYPAEPKVLKIFAPYDDISHWWDGWYRTFAGGRQIAKAGLNPGLAALEGLDQEANYFERLYDFEHKAWVVKHWKTLDVDDPIREKWGVVKPNQLLAVNMTENIHPDSGEPIGPVIYTVTNDSGQKKNYYLSASGTLKVFIRELRTFLGYMDLNTGGIVDIRNLSGELAGLEMRAKQAGIPLHNLPLVLIRRREAIYDPKGNKTYHYNVHIGIDPDFASKLAVLQDVERDKWYNNLLSPGDNVQLTPGDRPAVLLAEDEDDYFGENEEIFADVVDLDYEEEATEAEEVITIGTYSDFWRYGEQLGLDMNAERETVDAIWRDTKDNSSGQVLALRRLAGLED